jgi:phosphonate transport system ATP-binding protein
MFDDQPVVQLKRVSWLAGKQLIVSDVSIEIYQGQRVAILGPNGAGKSSLLKLMGMMIAPSFGELHLLGTDMLKASVIERRRLRRRVAWIPQGLQVVGRLSARVNAVLGALGRVSPIQSLFGWFPASELQNASHALDEVGMLHLANRRTDTLSGGERQKVAIARALVQGGDVVLADEPIAALDPVASREMLKLLKELSMERGLTTVVVLHDVDLALEFADRILGVKHGRVVVDVRAEQVRRSDLDDLYHSNPVVNAIGPAIATDHLPTSEGLKERVKKISTSRILRRVQ